MNRQDGVREVLLEAVVDFLPELPNLTLKRSLGGVKNEYGEIENEQYDSFPIAAVVIPITAGEYETMIGATERADAVAIWLADDPKPQLKDDVIFAGETFRVISYTPYNLNGITEFHSATLQRYIDQSQAK